MHDTLDHFTRSQFEASRRDTPPRCILIIAPKPTRTARLHLNYLQTAKNNRRKCSPSSHDCPNLHHSRSSLNTPRIGSHTRPRHSASNPNNNTRPGTRRLSTLLLSAMSARRSLHARIRTTSQCRLHYKIQSQTCSSAGRRRTQQQVRKASALSKITHSSTKKTKTVVAKLGGSCFLRMLG